MRDLIRGIVIGCVCAVVFGATMGFVWFTLSTLRTHDAIFRQHAGAIQQIVNALQQPKSEGKDDRK